MFQITPKGDKVGRKYLLEFFNQNMFDQNILKNQEGCILSEMVKKLEEQFFWIISSPSK